MTQQFERFYHWTNKTMNLQLEGYKQNQLQRRITTIMQKNDVVNLEDYAQLMERNPVLRKEFLDYITINVTEFYRNKPYFLEFEREFLKRHKQEPTLKLWSAACSTGAEAYSLGISLHKHGLAAKTRILGTDIDETILERAQKGWFHPQDVRNVEAADLKRYFSKVDKYYHISNEIQKLTTFRKQDLITDCYEKGFHAILCRNVTIYFNNEVKEAIYGKIAASLLPGGIFFTGATETVYKPEQYGLRKIGSFLYEKCNEGGR